MSLKKLLLEADLPDELMNIKWLTVPRKFFKKKKAHLDFYDCNDLNYTASKEDLFYETLQDALEGTSSKKLKRLFEAISFNEFLANEDKYCEKCSLDAYIFINDFESSELYTGAEFFVNALTLMINRVQKNILVEPSVAWKKVFEHDTALKIFQSFKESRILVKNFRNYLTSDTFGVETFESREVFENELWDYIKEDTLNNLSFKNSTPMVSFIESLKNVFETQGKIDNTFVIFDGSLIKASLLTKFLKLEEISDLASKIIFREGFNLEPFTVLPYFEFEALKIMFKKLNVLDASTFTGFTKNVAFSEFKPDAIVLETMKSLHDKNNPSMSNYQNLFEVAVNV